MDQALVSLIRDNNPSLLLKELDWFKSLGFDIFYLTYQQGTFLLDLDPPFRNPFTLKLDNSMSKETMMAKIHDHLMGLFTPDEIPFTLHIKEERNELVFTMKVRRRINMDLQLSIMQKHEMLDPPLLAFRFLEHDSEDGMLRLMARSDKLFELMKAKNISVSTLYYYYLKEITGRVLNSADLQGLIEQKETIENMDYLQQSSIQLQELLE